MESIIELSERIKEVEAIKINFTNLVVAAKNKFALACDEESTKWMYANAKTSMKSTLLNYFSLDKYMPTGDTNSFDVSTVIKGATSQSMLLFIFYFLIFFFIIFLLSFSLYCKCGRQCCNIFSCGLFLSKKKKHVSSKHKEDAQVRDVESHVTKKEESTTGYEENEMVRDTEGLESIENEQNENMATYKSQNKEENIQHSDSNMSRVIIKCIVYLFSLLLLGTVIILYIQTTVTANKNIDYVVKDVCGIIKTAEHIFIGSCDVNSSTSANGSTTTTPCFSVTEALADGLIILNNYKTVLQSLNDQNMLSTGETILILQEVEHSINKLKSLKINVRHNSALLSNYYKHSLLMEKLVTEVTDTILKNIESNQEAMSHNVRASKKTIIEANIQLESILKKDVAYMLGTADNLLTKLKGYVSQPGDNNTLSVTSISHKVKHFIILFHVLMVPLYIMVIICCLFIYHFVNGNESTSNKIIVRSTGLFSAFCGILTFIIMIYTAIFIFFSMVSSTTCVMTENDALSNNGVIVEYVSNVPILNTCFENKPLIDIQYFDDILKRVDDFDSKTLTEKMNEFFAEKQKILTVFEHNLKHIADNLWLVHVNHEPGSLHSKIKNDAVKNALIITHIYKHSIDTIPKTLDVDAFLKIANPILLDDSYALCYEDVTCQNDANKYNITKDSTTDDAKYKIIRGHARIVNGGSVGQASNPAEDLDIVLQILSYKAKILHEHIFTVSDLDPKQQGKLHIQEYIAPSRESEKNTSFIYSWLFQYIEELKNPKHLNEFKGAINTFVQVKDHSISQIKRYTQKLTCEVIMENMKTVRQHFCTNAAPGIAYMTVLYFVMGIFSFLLWLYFLCMWLHHKMIMEIEEAENKQ